MILEGGRRLMPGNKQMAKGRPIAMYGQDFASIVTHTLENTAGFQCSGLGATCLLDGSSKYVEPALAC